MIDDDIPANLNKPVEHVNWADLKRFGEGTYKSWCPFCDAGVLLMRRDQETFILEAEDNCIKCGQMVIYDDIEDLRKKEQPE